MEGAGDVLWRGLRRHPYLGIVIAVGAGAVVATEAGAGVVAVGLAVGFAAYLILKKDVPPSQALEDVLGDEDRLRP